MNNENTKRTEMTDNSQNLNNGKTRVIRRSSSFEDTGTKFADIDNRNQRGSTQMIDNPYMEFSDGGTRKLDDDRLPENGESSKTKLYRQPKEDDEVQTEWDPVVGWLIITKGCGIGKSFELGDGHNSVGRAKTQKVSVDFGDNTISRENHFRVTYDTDEKIFFLSQPGDVRNTIRLNGKLVLESKQLNNFDIINLGNTEFRFIAFCGENFSWEK